MTSLNRPARLNRALLAFTGVLLLAAGGFALSASLDWLTVVDPATRLVPGTAAPPTWVLYTVVAVAVVTGLLCLRWLAAQLAHTPKTHTWRFEDDPDRGHTELAASTVVQPFIAELGTYDGVHSARATLAGTRQAPTLAVVITAERDADLSGIRRQLDTHGLPRLRQALDLDTLPVAAEFRYATKAGARVR